MSTDVSIWVSQREAVQKFTYLACIVLCVCRYVEPEILARTVKKACVSEAWSNLELIIHRVEYQAGATLLNFRPYCCLRE